MKKFVLALAMAGCVACAQPAKKNDQKQTQKQAQAKEETTPQKDLVCGMTVDPKTAEAKYAYKVKMYYFCSKEDQESFQKEPDKYVPKK